MFNFHQTIQSFHIPHHTPEFSSHFRFLHFQFLPQSVLLHRILISSDGTFRKCRDSVPSVWIICSKHPCTFLTCSGIAHTCRDHFRQRYKAFIFLTIFFHKTFRSVCKLFYSVIYAHGQLLSADRQIPSNRSASTGLNDTPHFLWPSKWYFPLQEKILLFLPSPSPVWIAH